MHETIVLNSKRSSTAIEAPWRFQSVAAAREANGLKPLVPARLTTRD
jgi:hypothetical protein